jgi:hypothetical protein
VCPVSCVLAEVTCQGREAESSGGGEQYTVNCRIQAVTKRISVIYRPTEH